MNKNLCDNWTGFSASIPGSGHIRRGLPCQDASAAITAPRPALIVCDGRGSASCSQDGAQGAVKAFKSQIAVFEPMLASILDNDVPPDSQWEMFARIMYRTLMQVKLDLAEERGIPEKEFDFTVAFAIIGDRSIGCFQVGDGAIVLRQKGENITAFPPDKGEFANQTHFLRENGEASGKFHAALFKTTENTGVAITSDGPEHLMFKLKDMTPGKVFGVMLDDLHDQNLCWQDIMDYLTRRDWDNDPRGADDRSLAILAPLVYPQPKEAPITSSCETDNQQSTDNSSAKEDAAPSDAQSIVVAEDAQQSVQNESNPLETQGKPIVAESNETITSVNAPPDDIPCESVSTPTGSSCVQDAQTARSQSAINKTCAVVATAVAITSCAYAIHNGRIAEQALRDNACIQFKYDCLKDELLHKEDPDFHMPLSSYVCEAAENAPLAQLPVPTPSAQE
ncbi:MAG: protein phosphatase 2C domain-containing protein [Victivallales bacterium]|nr:protein phosphatase 2C domain-containing protein [Victivallales bacterium]